MVARQNRRSVAGAAPAPGFRLLPQFRKAFREFRAVLDGHERALYDLTCLAGHLGQALPTERSNTALVTGAKDPRRRLRRLATSRPDCPTTPEAWSRAVASLTPRLVEYLGDVQKDSPKRPLRILLNNASIALAPDCEVPTEPPILAAWQFVVSLFSTLFSAQVSELGRLRWLDAPTMRALEREARPGLQRGRQASGRRPGLAGRRLAIDPRLLRRASKALRRRIVPAYEACYVYYAREGDFFWPHPDNPQYPVNILVCVHWTPPRNGARPSAFRAYYPNGSMTRHELTPGEALVAEARGVIHAREPLGPGEKVALLSISAY